MVRAAGVALLIVSGCTLPEYFSVSYWQRDSSGQTTGLGVTRQGGSTSVTLAGNPDVVAQRFRQALAQLGMTAQITTDAEGIKISSVSRSGKRLSVALKHEIVMGAEQTQVQMEWIGGSDSEVEQQLMRLVVGARN
jgi:hypothetical protein